MTFKQWVSHVFGPESRAARASRRDKSRLTWRQQRSPSFKPILELLEDRALLSGTPGSLDAFLLTPVPDGSPVAMHIHPHLSILVNGQNQVIPADIGVQADGDLPMHTHDDSGTIHIESPMVQEFTLQDFFTVWGQSFSSQNVLGHQVDSAHPLVMTVNGQVSSALGSLVLHDQDNIVIQYGSAPSAATVSTDRYDYAPGATAVIGGSGFAAGETVTLQVLHIDGRDNTDDSHAPWTVVADAAGSFRTTWMVDSVDAAGSTLELTAVGQSSHTTADAIFTDSTSPPVPRPFWVIAHNPDDELITKQYLDRGVNGLEPDIEYFSAQKISDINATRAALGEAAINANPGYYIAHGNFIDEEVLIGSKYELPLLPLADYVSWLSGELDAGQTQLSLIIWDVKTAAAQGPDAIGTILSEISNLLVDHPEVRSMVNVGTQADATSLFTSKADDLFAALPTIPGVSYPQSIGFSIDGEDDVTATLPKLHTLLGDDVAFGFGDGSAGCCNSVFDVFGLANGFLAPNTPDAIARAAFERTAFGDLDLVSYAFSMHGVDSMKMMIDQGVDGLIPADNVDPTGNLALAGITSSTSEFGDTDDALAIVNSHYDNVYLATTADDPFAVPGATTNGVGATATATVDTSNDATKGQVTGVTITNAGFHYTTAPTVTFTGGGGSSAAGTATIDANGHVTGVTITNHGSGYTSAPVVTLNSVVTVTGSRQGYGLQVKTSDVLGGGTDANVSFTLKGANGSASITLDTSWSKMMERNDTNYVFIPSADLGALQTITVHEDGSGGKWGIGINSEWNLDWIKVRSFAYIGGGANDYYFGDYGGQDIGNPICFGVFGCADKGDQNPSTRGLTLAAYLSATSQATATGGVEGTTAATLADATFNDRNPDNSSFTVTAVDWGDNSTDASGLTISGSNGRFTVNGSHTYAEEGNYAFSITIKAGGTGPDANQTATINGEVDVADPAVVLTPATFQATEGTLSSAQTLATFTDPGGAEALTDYAVDVDWGNGTFVTDANVSISGPVGGVFTVSGQHLYADEDGFPGPVQVRITHEAGRLNEDSSPAEVVSVTPVPLTLIDPPVNASGATGPFLATEGTMSGVQTLATFTDPGGAETVPEYSADVDWGNGTFVSGDSHISISGPVAGVFTVTAQHLYIGEDGFTGPIRVRISHEDSTPSPVVSLPLSLTDPPLSAAGTSLAVVRGSCPIQTVATFTDPGGAEPNLVDAGPIGDHYTATIHWGDGTADDMGDITYNGVPLDDSQTNAFSVSGHHAYAANGTYTITVTMHHEGAVPDAVVTTKVMVASFLNHAQGYDEANSLVIGAAPSGSSILVVPVGKQTGALTDNVKILIGGMPQINPDTGGTKFSGFKAITIYGQAGNDNLEVAAGVKKNASIFGSGGKDRMKGGGRNNILVGGPGNDLIIGGLGRDILIGGGGNDRLVCGPGGDILIAGQTDFEDPCDPDDTARLLAIRAAWANSRATYTVRAVTVLALVSTNGSNAAHIHYVGGTIRVTGIPGQDMFFDSHLDPITGRPLRKR